MPKRYRLILREIEKDGTTKKVLFDMEDHGYLISNVMKSLAKKVYEPAPVVKLEGQQEMDLK